MPQQSSPPQTPPLAFAPFLGLAQQAQAAFAEATLATWRGTLENAQSAVETAQQAIDAARHIADDSGQALERRGELLPPSAGVEAMQDAAQRNVSLVNEMTACANRRAQAYLDLPNRIARCKSPQDLMSEQLRFWQNAARDYAEAGQRMVESLSGSATAAQRKVPTAQQILAGKGAAAAREPRDMVTFRDPPAAGQAEGRNPDGSPRRVA
jgi:hypothetical protein